jgi:hemerythrin-like domain-containing protein
MTPTQILREQHDELLKSARDLTWQLNAERIAAEAAEIRSKVSHMLGKLTVHIAMEDEVLYPELLRHDDPAVRAMARLYMEEMGSLGRIISGYKNAWPSSSAIGKDPDAFIIQTKAMFASLTKRIEKENTRLYPAIEKDAWRPR